MITYLTIYQAGNLSRIVGVSLFKMDHSQTQKGPATWKPASTE